MDIDLTEGREIVGSDDRKIGRIGGTRDGCVLLETGHVFKSTHAMPIEFVHEIDGELRATVAKEIVDGSPTIEGDEWNPREVQLYYGIGGPYRVDPDPDGVDNAETAGAREGIEPAPSERIRTLGEAQPDQPSVDDARVAQGGDGSYVPILPPKN
jgi:hypothetical protein